MEGFVLLHDEELLKLIDLSIYIDIPDEVGIERRMVRAGKSANREWYETVTFPEYAPRRKFFESRANLVLNGQDPLESNVQKIVEAVRTL